MNNNFKVYEITPEGFDALIDKQKTIRESHDLDFESMFVSRDSYRVEDNAAIIHIFGPLKRNASKFEKMAGITDYSDIAKDLEQASKDFQRGIVTHVLLRLDSPGGESIGSQEIGDIIKNFPIPVYGIIDGICFSAAYKIASSCTGIYSTVSSECGSIGTILVITNSKEAMNGMGIYNQIFTNDSALLKSIGQDFGNLTDDQKSFIQDRINESGIKFQNYVKENRPEIDEAVFTAGFYSSDKAIELHLIDGVF